MKENYRNDEFLKKRKARQKQIRKRRIKRFFAFFLVALLITAVILSLTVLFPIQSINAKGSKIYTSAQIVSQSGIEIGDNLFAISKGKVQNNLKSKLPFVEKIEFDRALPDSLTIKVTDAKEYACYKIGNSYYSVSESGWVLDSYSQKPEKLFEIVSKNVKCKVGTQVEFSDKSESVLTKDIIKLLNDSKISVDYIELTDLQNLKIGVEGRFDVLFGKVEDMEPKLKHLKSMMQEIGENKGGKIDLSMWSTQKPEGIFVQNATK